MKKLFILFAIILTCYFNGMAQKPFAIKKWKGRYPRMKNDYPFTFVSFKGWLPPIPHFFVRLYPSHYYYYLNSVPVSDGMVYTDLTLKHALRNVFKGIDRNALKKTMQDVSGIRLNQEGHLAIEDFLRNSRLTVLHDAYDVSGSFLQAGLALDKIRHSQVPDEIIKVFEKELNNHLESFLMINMMDAPQGDKVEAMEEIKSKLKSLTGLIHYSAQKIDYHHSMKRQSISHLGFLGS